MNNQPSYLIATSLIKESFFAPLVTGMIALLVTWFLTPYIQKFALLKGAVDDPFRDERRMHQKLMPKWGGLAIYPGILFSFIIALFVFFPKNTFPSYLISILVIGALVMIMGSLDDIYHFPAKVQALFLILIGFAVQYFSGPDYPLQIKGVEFPLFFTAVKSNVWISFHWLSWPLTALYIFVVTKTMDTIDGLDGLSAGIAAIAAITFSVLAIMGVQPQIAILAAAIGGSTIGFLKYNFNPAKIFIGTGGSQLLGFMLACMSIIGAFRSATALAIVVPFFVFGIPLFDALFVITKRLLAGQPVTQGDKRHIHHTLIDFGLSQRQAVIILYLITLILCTSLLVLVVSFYQR